MGNSEVGHTNIGSGRIILRDLSKISNEIEFGKFYESEVLKNIILKTKESKERLHLLGLLSSGGVHSHYGRPAAILKLCKKLDFKGIVIRCFADGRDTPSTSAKSNIKRLQNDTKVIGVGTIVFVYGRYYAVDRDRR